MPRQSPTEHDDEVKRSSDLERNPGIGASKGTTMAGADPEDIEGDIENDVTPNGAVDPKQRTHKRH